jgi:hypothetical protein
LSASGVNFLKPGVSWWPAFKKKKKIVLNYFFFFEKEEEKKEGSENVGDNY